MCIRDRWCAGHEAPSDRTLSSQRISDLLDAIDEGQCQHFFKIWGKKIVEREHLCYDITSVSSYAEQNAYVRYGYNRDGESLPQVNLALVLGQESCLPVSYRAVSYTHLYMVYLLGWKFISHYIINGHKKMCIRDRHMTPR